MRILHTSDWHLGRSFHQASLQRAQEEFVDRLVETIVTEQVDLLLVSGDVYDRALPSVDAVTLFDNTLVRLRETGVAMVITSGNHDSALRLGFGSALLEHAGLHLRTRVADIDRPVMIAAEGFELAVYGLPYLEPRMVAESLGVSAPGHPPVIDAALERVRTDLAARREAAAHPVHPVVLAHVFAAGGAGSDSERELSIGGLDIVPTSYFADFSYAALGHLHGRQTLAQNIRYSGSPIPYSFSEAGHHKGAWLLDIGVEGLGEVRAVNWPATKALRILKGTIDELLTEDKYASAEDAWCQITLTDTHRPAAAMERLRGRFPDTLVLNFEPAERIDDAHHSYAERLAAAKSPVEVCAGFVDHVRLRPLNDAEEALIVSVLDQVASEKVQA
ncbi:exonuclease SbcCD subunit D [Paeniglutamicibacter gangotriensis]|uniref:Nuclease SbcCD subunit D n=1 Tax=Paeniglutamicibacter gangotriensis Lz1y TaxID=1276920 RepID=M7MXL3_9MICC|nr:exonuclease SbcCD subunit D [Paeniglutamicibacter gangotriensis]EMQ99791.1 putative exonuclease SbcD [Paeniglutamicibacter gangotriensis Lz1y]